MIFVILCFALFPILYTFVVSIKSRVDLLTFPPKLLFKPTIEFWVEVIKNSDFLFYYKNSLIISSISVVVVLVVSCLAGYSLSRFNIKRKEDIAFWILSQSMTPAVAIILPIYTLFSRWGFVDTYHGIILVYSAFNIPFAVWFLRSFFNEIPLELCEAAKVDGCSPLRAFWSIDLPLVKPGLIACAIYTFVMCLNEFFFAFILTGTRVKPATVAVVSYLPTDVRGTMYGQSAVAGILIMTIPMIFFLFLQKYFVSGLIRGAIK